MSIELESIELHIHIRDFTILMTPAASHDSLMEEQAILVAAMYKFVSLPDYKDIQQPLLEFCNLKQIKGTILLAEEGLNGTVAGTPQAIRALLEYLRSDKRFGDLEAKESYVSSIPFYRMKVKLKKEIVTMGVPGIDPNTKSGVRVGIEQWNELISDPDTVVIDTRNQYECQVGTFKNAISPNTTSFREFPDYVRNNLLPQKDKKIAMFCTGGIRCEKATAYLMEQGFDKVFHLNGGILKYLEKVKPEENLWQGECFVFDGRVTVDSKLEKGNFEQCFACRAPLSSEDRASDKYEEGISCPHCYEKVTKDKKSRLRERQKQIELAEKRNTQHIGSVCVTSKQD